MVVVIAVVRGASDSGQHGIHNIMQVEMGQQLRTGVGCGGTVSALAEALTGTKAG